MKLSLITSCSALALTSIATTSTPAAAQETSASIHDEIVVVAQRREQSISDVGISVTAFSGERVNELLMNRAEDIQLLTPGLTASSDAGSAVSQFVVRGVGQSDFADHHEQPNVVYQDDIYISSPVATGFPLFDLERVEVLRGPQGTLFGRNATGGVLHFISKRPTEEFEIGGVASAGERATFKADGYVSGPLTDSLSVRLAGTISRANGFTENLIGDDLDTNNKAAIRGQVLWTPSEQTSVLLNAQGFQQDDDAGYYKAFPSFFDDEGNAQFLPPNVDAFGTGPGNDLFGYRTPDDPFTLEADFIGFIKKNVFTYGGTVEHDFGPFSLTSVTAYNDTRSRYAEDCDGSPNAVCLYRANATVDQLSQEVRLNGEIDNITWTAGGYYLDIDGTYFTSFELPTFLVVDDITGGADLRNNYTLDTESWAVFAQGEWELNDRITLIGGVRYTNDEKVLDLQTDCLDTVADGCSTLFAVGDVPGSAATLGAIALDRTDTSVAARAEIDFRIQDDWLAYFRFDRGIKGGTFTVPLDGLLTADELPVEQEVLYSYEVGSKSTLADGRFGVNTSAFYYDYNDFQVFQFTDVSSIVLNRDARAYGGELEVIGRPMDGLDVMFGLAYLDFVVDGVVTPTAPEGEEQVPVNAPELQANWMGRQTVPWLDRYQIAGQYAGYYVSSRFFNSVNAPVVEDEGYMLHNVRLGVGDAEGRWEIAVFADNVSNTTYRTKAFDLTGLGYTNLRFGRPRTVGVTARVSY